MIQFILDEQVEVRWEAEMEIVGQVHSVIPPWQADDLDRVPLAPQIFHQFAVVEIAAAKRIEQAVDEKSQIHFYHVTLSEAKSLSFCL